MLTSPVSPAVVIKHIHDWNGQVVTVEGWLGKCEGYDCRIFSSKNDSRIVDAHNFRSDEWMEALLRGLSIGSQPEFDREAVQLQNSYVRIKARINTDCWPAECIDRADVLQPITIEAIRLPEKEK